MKTPKRLRKDRQDYIPQKGNIPVPLSVANKALEKADNKSKIVGNRIFQKYFRKRTKRIILKAQAKRQQT